MAYSKKNSSFILCTQFLPHMKYLDDTNIFVPHQSLTFTYNVSLAFNIAGKYEEEESVRHISILKLYLWDGITVFYTNLYSINTKFALQL